MIFRSKKQFNQFYAAHFIISITIILVISTLRDWGVLEKAEETSDIEEEELNNWE